MYVTILQNMTKMWMNIMKTKQLRIVLSTLMTLVMILGCLALPPSGSVSQAASKLKVTAPKQ